MRLSSIRILLPLGVAIALAGCDNLLTTPTPDNGLLPGWQFAVLGSAHTCGLYENGGTYCWGDDRWGQLGTAGDQDATCTTDGVANPCRPSPLPMTAQGFYSLTAGPFYTCGVANDGLYCWGTGTRMVGKDSSNVPFKLANATFADIASGPENICGISYGGAVYCLESSGTPGSLNARLMNTDAAFAVFSGAGSHFCVLAVTGAASCWGENGSGELGTGTADAEQHLNAELVATDLRFRRISAGFGTTCAISADNVTYCWGDRPLGGPTASDSLGSLAPQQVSFSQPFLAISAGRGFACGITGVHDAYCWGRNENGQLGSGATDGQPHSTPQLVAGGHRFRFIAAGEYHACGVTDEGDMYCWGMNDSGQLGQSPAGAQCTSDLGTRYCVATPVLVQRPDVAALN